MASRSTMLFVLKLVIATLLAAWSSVWILRPTPLWKRSWHKAENWADSTILREPGLDVIVYCFPVLAVAILVYIYLDLHAREGKIRRKRPLVSSASNQIIDNSPIGTVSSSELIASSLFIIFLAWTYYWNVASDLRKMTPSKSLSLNRWQLRLMSIGVRFGSLSEACFALLLLPVLRGMALFGLCGVQFESAIRYHVWLGNATMFFSVLHGAIIMCVWGSKNSLWNEITRWQRTGRINLAGGLALLTGLVIWITSLPQLRRKSFSFFYLCHHLYVLFILFFLLHAGAGHFYLVFSGVFLFAIDKIQRIIQSRGTTYVISARLLPCKAVELTFPKEQCMQYAPTSMLFVKIPSVSKFQWHPFSITSSASMEDDRVSLVIKCQGSWTNSLYEKVQSIERETSNDTKSLLIAVEGPYGPTKFTYQRYDWLVLIAGGSGITPFLSILQDVASRNRSTNNYCEKIQLIYVVKRLEDLSMLTPVADLLLNKPADLGHVILRFFVTKEKEASRTSIEEVLYEMCQVKTITFHRGSNGYGFRRPEGFLSKAVGTGLTFIIYLVALECLTHAIVRQGKRASHRKIPSWISDILILGSFVIAACCNATIATVLSKWRKSMNCQSSAGSNNNKDHFQINSESNADMIVKHDINFGQRPNLKDILLELSGEPEESNVGVFVCGPDSMQQSVASFCRKYSQKCGTKSKHSYAFHSINFSL